MKKNMIDKTNNMELCRFKNYLYYYRRISEEKMLNMTEAEFHILKDFYKEEEHHELDADYADFMDIVNSYFA